MKLAEKYISASENSKNPDPTKAEISDDAYAVCEFIEKLMGEVAYLRRSHG